MTKMKRLDFCLPCNSCDTKRTICEGTACDPKMVILNNNKISKVKERLLTFVLSNRLNFHHLAPAISAMLDAPFLTLRRNRNSSRRRWKCWVGSCSLLRDSVDGVGRVDSLEFRVDAIVA